MAIGLGVPPKTDPVEGIVEYCFRRINRWTKGSSANLTIDQLEKLILKKLKMVIEEVHSDHELDQVIAKYTGKGEFVFATLKEGFSGNTFGTLFERKTNVTAASPDRYVAVIDCRGDKAFRRFFTRWHEIAHALTLYKQLELPLHRYGSDPEERLMDHIAAKVGFYPSIFQPLVNAAIAKQGRLSFDSIDEIRSRFAPSASYEATMNACMAATDVPTLKLVIGYGLKKSEQATITQFENRTACERLPQAKLRALTVRGNSAAKNSSFRIYQNMRIPKESALARAFADRSYRCRGVVEELSTWTTSAGQSLPPHQVCLDARECGQTFVALVSLRRS